MIIWRNMQPRTLVDAARAIASRKSTPVAQKQTASLARDAAARGQPAIPGMDGPAARPEKRRK